MTVELFDRNYVEPTLLIISQEDLRALIRYEITGQELKGNYPSAFLTSNDFYQMTLDDLEVALWNLHNSDATDEEILEGWLHPVLRDLEEEYGIQKAVDGETEDAAGDQDIPGLPTASSIIDQTLGALIARYWEGDQTVDLTELLQTIRQFRRDRDLPLSQRTLTLTQMTIFVSEWDNARVAAFGTPEIEALYTKCVNALAEANVPLGLREKAYACYGKGNAGFDEDWEASRDCLLKLEEIAPEADYANTLGYIYYYGRCNGGVPEYEKAFYWFSLGAAGGIYESRYKLADLIKDGKGCHKSPKIARKMIEDLYGENLDLFCLGKANTKFADISLRMGKLHLSDDPEEDNPAFALSCFLMAKTAIRMRRQSMDAYGDARVEAAIDQALANVIETHDCFKKNTRPTFDSLVMLLFFGLGLGLRRWQVDYTWKDDRTLKLVFRMQAKSGERYAPKIPVTILQSHFCGFLEKMTVTAKLVDGAERQDALGFLEEKGTHYFDEVKELWGGGNALLAYGKEVAQLPCTFTICCRNIAGKSNRYVAVAFDDADMPYQYLCDDPSIQPGTRVLVPFGKKEREGTVLRACERFDSELELPKRAYRQVIRAL
ncbi:MAG: hypothetical protein Q4D06_06840 [Coriobacteriia bacterium]|nr:hypothetical protein [Coriobacteriia bacterium]